ncbi:MAG TPA: tetratricopeptide repeat protein [Dissulfurispiraceae bacterium]
MKKLIVLAIAIMLAAGCQQKQEPKSAQVQYPGGQPVPNQAQTEQELKAVQEVITKDPHNVNAWVKLGNLLMDNSRFNEAIAAYQNALSINPKNIDVRVDLGTCLRSAGKPDLAAVVFKQAIELNPKHAIAHRNLAVVLAYDLKDKSGGIREFEKYLELAPYAPDAFQIRQAVAEMKGKK